MTRSVLLTLAYLGSALAAKAAPPPPQLEAYLSYPFLTELTAPENGGKLAWVEMRRGVRNVWLLSGPSATPLKLTAGNQDDGMELAELAFSPDGRILAWIRGGGEHNSWASKLAPPNPASATVQPTQDIWISIDGGEPFKAAEGEEPTISATGRLAYIKDNQAWTVDLKPGSKPAKLFYDRGSVGSLAWSPDGSRLAFVSARGNHSFVGIYTAADKPIVWMAPSFSFDENPVWSPDGQRIAFSRRDDAPDILASPLVERPSPFSIYVVSADDGEGRAIWTSPPTLNGSFPEVPDGLFLMWAAGDRITFRAEMDGWPHLYSLKAQGGTAELLTPGNFTVEHVRLSPDRKTLFYDANAGDTAGDIDRRHLFRVAADKASPHPLTAGSGVEFTSAPIGDDRLAYISAGPTMPMTVMMAGTGDKSPALISEGSDYSAPLVSPIPVSFKAADGTEIHGQVFETKGGAERKPGLIFVHGGPPRQMLLGWSYMDYYTHAYAMNQYYAAHGYVVLSVNYRLGIGYGRAFQHPAKAGAAGNSEYQDVVAGAHLLQERAGVDPARIAIWGGSYGGLLTAHALANNSDIFKAGVDFHGVHDWSLYPGRADRPQRYEQGDYDMALKTAFESSPEAWLKRWTSPVLLIHGDDDRNVRFDQTVDLARRLAAQGTPFESLILPNEIHGFLRYDSWLRADSAAVRFLQEKMKPLSN